MVIQLVKSSSVEAKITIVPFEISCGDPPNSILYTSSDSNGWVATRDFKRDNGNWSLFRGSWFEILHASTSKISYRVARNKLQLPLSLLKSRVVTHPFESLLVLRIELGRSPHEISKVTMVIVASTGDDFTSCITMYFHVKYLFSCALMSVHITFIPSLHNPTVISKMMQPACSLKYNNLIANTAKNSSWNP